MVLAVTLEPAMLQAFSSSAKTAAMALLAAAFILAVAVVPFEFIFFRSVKTRQLVKALALEFWVFALIVLILAGVVLDWYATPRGLLVLLGMFIIFLAATAWFFLLRYRMIASLHVQVTLTRERAKQDLELLLQAIKESAEEEQKKEGGQPEAKDD